MQIEIQLFARAAELAGQASITIDVPAQATLADLRGALGTCCPPLQPLLPHVTFAVNRQYVGDDYPLNAGVEIACIPPVSGG